MDDIDVQLLAMLQKDGRRSQQELAQSVGLSSPAVGERLRKLEERGVIRRYTAVIEPLALGLDVAAFIVVGTNGSRHYSDFRSRALEWDEVLECHSVTGRGSHLLKVRTTGTAGLERLLSEIQAWPGVQWTETSLVLSTPKETSDLPIEGERLELRVSRDRSEPSVFYVPFRHQKGGK